MRGRLPLRLPRKEEHIKAPAPLAATAMPGTLNTKETKSHITLDLLDYW